jgi:hypothetical protein
MGLAAAFSEKRSRVTVNDLLVPAGVVILDLSIRLYALKFKLKIIV